MTSSFRLLVGALALVLVGGVGCGKTKAGVVPVNNPTSGWTAPEADEVFPEEEEIEPETADGEMEEE